MIDISLVFQVYKDDDELWRWRCRNPSTDKIIAESAEGYADHRDCKRTIDLLKAGAARGRVDDPIMVMREFYKKTPKS